MAAQLRAGYRCAQLNQPLHFVQMLDKCLEASVGVITYKGGEGGWPVRCEEGLRGGACGETDLCMRERMRQGSWLVGTSQVGKRIEEVLEISWRTGTREHQGEGAVA